MTICNCILPVRETEWPNSDCLQSVSVVSLVSLSKLHPKGKTPLLGIKYSTDHKRKGGLQAVYVAQLLARALEL